MKRKTLRKKNAGNETEVVCAEMESGKWNPKKFVVTLRACEIQQKAPKL